MKAERLSRLILIPGLLEPRFVFLPLQISLQKQGLSVEIWHDRLAFRSLENSVNRLADTIEGNANNVGSIGIVTHSFGDWIARAAIAKSERHRVRTMVSLAPAMRVGFLPCLLYAISGNLIPEIEVLMDEDRASANIDCDYRIRRLVVWSCFDESVRSVPLDHLSNVDVTRVCGTHLSMACQPNVIRLVNSFLLGDQSSSCPAKMQ